MLVVAQVIPEGQGDQAHYQSEENSKAEDA
jgi:hypothetical protein